MDFRLAHLCPDLMNLYGSRANVSVLKRCLERMGHTVTVDRIQPGAEADAAATDFLFMGAGTERAARAAMKDLVRYSDSLQAAAEAGTVMLFAGTAMELLGRTVTEAGGETYQGLGLASFQTVHGEQRILGDVYGYTKLFPEPVVGFMNKCGIISGVETPLLTDGVNGFGNAESCEPEGFQWKNVFASELTGPILVKNPRLLEILVRRLLACRGQEAPKEFPRDEWAERAYQVTEEQLRLRWSL